MSLSLCPRVHPTPFAGLGVCAPPPTQQDLEASHCPIPACAQRAACWSGGLRPTSGGPQG
eukprot:11943555-Alexandrium_andersonii.AAC.1